ncbi:MAG: histidine--tRNA ligase, partial [Deltaproteobacteria bacterium]
MAVRALKGFKDILPDEVGIWQHIEVVARDIFHRFGFSEIKVPILEKTELFVRSIGEATDIVEKEMYTFTDRNGAMVTMRPEGTASVLRAFVENSLHAKQPLVKLYTVGPMFRHERPQKGRLRQFHQLSVEALGSDNPRLDAELMAMAWLVLNELGVKAGLEVNSLGCPECRPAFKRKLVDFLRQYAGQVCEDCERRRDTNPLRVLDCKSEKCREKYAGAPSILDNLCPGCREHFEKTKAGLAQLDIPYSINPSMVRGLDYYTRTTFELITDALGAQSAVGAGGRYDGL